MPLAIDGLTVDLGPSVTISIFAIWSHGLYHGELLWLQVHYTLLCYQLIEAQGDYSGPKEGMISAKIRFVLEKVS